VGMQCLPVFKYSLYVECVSLCLPRMQLALWWLLFLWACLVGACSATAQAPDRDTAFESIMAFSDRPIYTYIYISIYTYVYVYTCAKFETFFDLCSQQLTIVRTRGYAYVYTYMHTYTRIRKYTYTCTCKLVLKYSAYLQTVRRRNAHDQNVLSSALICFPALKASSPIPASPPLPPSAPLNRTALTIPAP